MLEINSIRDRLQEIFKKICFLKDIFKYDINKIKLTSIYSKLNNPIIWKDKKKINSFIKEASSLEKSISKIDEINSQLIENLDFLNLLLEEKDDSIDIIKKEIVVNLIKLEKMIKDMEFYKLLSKKHDICNCYMSIQSGSGGVEARDWTKMLLRMYLKWIESHHFKYTIINEFEDDSMGIKSIEIKIEGLYSYGWLRTESGIHRLVRKSPFDTGKRRHTSFSSVYVYPDIFDKDMKVNINLSDLRIDYYRASGSGGQHVNRTESAVRITHLPTNIVTQSQYDRSQHKNKDQAMKQLERKLFLLKKQEKYFERKSIENKKLSIRWGNQIRSYILDDSRIKDLRTGIEIRDIQSVLDGKIDKFIKESLKFGL